VRKRTNRKKKKKKTDEEGEGKTISPQGQTREWIEEEGGEVTEKARQKNRRHSSTESRREKGTMRNTGSPRGAFLFSLQFPWISCTGKEVGTGKSVQEGVILVEDRGPNRKNPRSKESYERDT